MERAPDARGIQTAVMVGDPDKPGFYVVLTKWLKGHHFSHPHFHPNDRYITVLQGTWWVGTGARIRSRAQFRPDARRQLRHPFRQAGCTGTAPRTKTPCWLIIGRGPGHRDRGGGEQVAIV